MLLPLLRATESCLATCFARRPDMNMARMKRSTTRLRLADYDADVSFLSHCCSPVNIRLLDQCSATLLVEPRSIKTCPAIQEPDHPLQELLSCLKELLRIDKNWLPHQEGYSMYIRPFAFSSAHTLGISRPSRYRTTPLTASTTGSHHETGLIPMAVQNSMTCPGRYCYQSCFGHLQ